MAHSRRLRYLVTCELRLQLSSSKISSSLYLVEKEINLHGLFDQSMGRKMLI